MRRIRRMTLAAIALAPTVGILGSTPDAVSATPGPAAAVAAPAGTGRPPDPGDLSVEERNVGIVTWCHGALQCLFVAELCPGIFIYDEVDEDGEPTHGYCEDSVAAPQRDGRSLSATRARVGKPVLSGGPVCPEGTFLSPFEMPVYDDEGLFVIGYETVWYCISDDLEPAG